MSVESASSLSSNVLMEDMTTSNLIPSKDGGFNGDDMSDSEDDNDISFTRGRGKSTRFAESDSETDKENNCAKLGTASSPLKSASDEDSNKDIVIKKKSRIKNNSNSDSESHTEQDNNKNELTRTKLKSKKLQDKFKKLKKSTKNGLKRQSFESKLNTLNDEKSSDENDRKATDSDESNDGLENSDDDNSCLKIKQKVVNKSLASICDPDTSDEESNYNAKPQKSRPRSIKPTSPKPVRMSAKEAMENMQKIKSESNRMLREKEVSLPYHRPKALSLKDIMSRRRPAVTSDGKSLPIKMNNEQLKHYATLLEQRQKEMIELCKSDTEDEEENCPENPEKESEFADESGNGEKQTKEQCTISSEANDKMFDITMEQSLNESKDESEKQNLDEKINNELQLEDVRKVNDQEIIAENLIEQCETINTETQNKSSTVETVIVSINSNDNERHSVQTEKVSENILNQESRTDTENDCKNAPLLIRDINKNSEEESQIISLHYDTDKTDAMDVDDSAEDKKDTCDKTELVSKEVSDGTKQIQNLSNEFSDDDFTVEDLDRIIEDAEINKDDLSKPMPNIGDTLKIKPKLTGAPGMVIDLDEDESSTQKKLTGVELLKERFTYFAKLKSLEDKEKDREKKFKPGIQHLKLKQELEEQIAEKRSLEWEKRLEEESKLKAEMDEVEDGEGFDGEDIEKIEAKLEQTEVIDEPEDSSEEEIEDDVDMTDKPRKRNPMVDDEAEESEEEAGENMEDNEDKDDDVGGNGDKENNSSESEDDDDSSESELEEEQTKPKKGRILKAFEDSDDEDCKGDSKENKPKSQSQDIAESQDDDIQLAQLQRSYSEDLFTSQECSQKSSKTTEKPRDILNDNSFENDLGTQTFSILKSSCINTGTEMNGCPEKLDVICETQPCSDDNFDAIVGMCTGNFAENLVSPQAVSSQLTQSQELGEDVAALCTGKFYDNPLVSQSEIDNENVSADDSMNISNSETQIDNIEDAVKSVDESVTGISLKPQLNDVEKPEKSADNPNNIEKGENKLLKSILDELDDPEFDVPKPNKYFFRENVNQDKDNSQLVDNTQAKKKFVIESDDETNEEAEVISKKKKRKKRKLEDRALQFSDDEEDLSEEEEAYESEIEEDNDRLVEYDSEENEVEIQAKPSKKKRIGAFFEQEAELTSEDEWMGSGDEDEAGLDRMEREEGDDDTFHQGKLQRELGEIHMREVLDQDKREVRLLQELLFEDGDLGDGHRQRKFRWKNADGEEEMGTNADEYADTQEDEFESEEQWRKERHEREMFLRSLQEKDEEDASVTINRSALIKANLTSKPTPTIADVMNKAEKPKTHETEKKTTSDIPSPKKPFTIFQQSCHNSLLTRGRGALARLAALATPLAGDDDAPKVNASSTRGNFVFAAITPDETEPKVTKRKAEANPDTPRLLKKMRKQDSNKNSKISILDHL